jgi:hypothetical protein
MQQTKCRESAHFASVSKEAAGGKALFLPKDWALGPGGAVAPDNPDLAPNGAAAIKIQFSRETLPRRESCQQAGDAGTAFCAFFASKKNQRLCVWAEGALAHRSDVGNYS